MDLWLLWQIFILVFFIICLYTGYRQLIVSKTKKDQKEKELWGLMKDLKTELKEKKKK